MYSCMCFKTGRNDVVHVKQTWPTIYYIVFSYWDYVMYNKLFNRIDVDTNYKDEIKGITPDSIRQFAAELLKQNNRIEVTMLSKQL